MRACTSSYYFYSVLFARGFFPAGCGKSWKHCIGPGLGHLPGVFGRLAFHGSRRLSARRPGHPVGAAEKHAHEWIFHGLTSFIKMDTLFHPKYRPGHGHEACGGMNGRTRPRNRRAFNKTIRPGQPWTACRSRHGSPAARPWPVRGPDFSAVQKTACSPPFWFRS